MRRALAVAAIALTVLVAGGAAADTFTVTLVSQTSSTITLGWDPQPGYGYLFSAGGVLVSRTNDPDKSSVKFSKVTSASYDIDVIVKGANGHYPVSAPADTTPPSVSLTSPANGATVSGTVTVSATATDNVDVTKVEFFRDGSVFATDTTSPYSVTFDTTTVANGAHTFGPRAYDAAGNATSGAAVAVTVSNTQASGTITQTIANGSTVSGTVAWRAVYDANADGVEDDPGSVSFLVDGVQVLNEINAPFGDTAGFWDSSTVANGSHAFRVDALNGSNAVVATNTVTANVSNGVPPTPQCSDGIDNADPEDTLVDMADPGCSSPTDNDETNTSPTGCATATPNVPDGPDGLGGCFAGPSNTGPDAAADWPGQFTAKGQPGCTLPIQSNTTYRFCDFGSIAVGSSGAPVNNVTFHGCRFKTVAVEDANIVVYGADGGSGITFEYVEIAPGVSAPPTPYSQSYQYGIVADGAYGSFVGRLTVDHSDIWGFGNAIVIEGSTQANPHVFTANYVHDAAQDGGSYHTDGIGDLSDSGVGSYVVLDHNTIISVGNTNGIAFQRGVYDHFTVTRNLLSGFGFTTAIWASLGSSSITFTDNTYSTVIKPFFGPLYPQSFWTTSGSLWKRNRWAVPPGAAWGNTAHNGWYWLPNTSTIDGQSTPSDTPFVSTTDYGG